MSVRTLGWGRRGPAGTIAIGSVTQGPPGSQPAVTNSGSTIAATLNFTFPASRDGTNGTTPTLAIGTVTTLAAGAQATASITGSGSAYQVNLGLPAGVAGTNGQTATFTIGSVTTLAAGASATVTLSGAGPAYTLSFGIPAGAAGSNATATPLATTQPAALGATAQTGSSTAAARSDHVHPLPAGRLELIGTYTQTETMLVALNVGVARRTATLNGVLANDRLLAILVGAPTAGCELLNVYPTAANTISIGLYLPALGIGSTYTVPIAVYRIAQ
jgi:hypothetical protein